MSWEWDAHGEVYRNHALSKDLRMAAIANAVFAQFASSEGSYGKMMGESITLPRMQQLRNATRISEHDQLPVVRPLQDVVAISVSEWGNKIVCTEWEKMLNAIDLNNPYQKALMNQMMFTMDAMYAEALKKTKVKFIPTAAATGTFDTDGTPSSSATNNLSLGHIQQIKDYMEQLKVPTFPNGKYAAVLSTKAKRGFLNDATIREWMRYHKPEMLTSGFLTEIEDIMFHSTNHYEALDNTIGTNNVTGEALFFGADAFTVAEVQTPELRKGLAYDLGRFSEIGWVGKLDAGLIWPEASMARVIHLTSS